MDQMPQFFSAWKPQKIVLVLDVSRELSAKDSFDQQEDQSQATRFEHLRKALEIFLRTKKSLCKEHEYSLVTLDENAQTLVNFTREIEDILDVLNQLEPYSEAQDCNINSLFELLESQLGIREGKGLPYALQIILVYGRRDVIPELDPDHHVLRHQDVFIDFVYIQGNNDESSCAFDKLKATESAMTSKLCYCFKIRTDINRLFRAFGLLSAHVKQRISQIYHPPLLEAFVKNNRSN